MIERIINEFELGEFFYFFFLFFFSRIPPNTLQKYYIF
jgi:hypothetical protein